MDLTAKLWASTGHSLCLIDCNGKYVRTLLIVTMRSLEKNWGQWVKLLPEKKKKVKQELEGTSGKLETNCLKLLKTGREIHQKMLKFFYCFEQE